MKTLNEKGSALRDMKKISHSSKLRYDKTIAFVQKWIEKNSKILDLGVANPLGEEIRAKGYKITNTNWGQDLDEDFSVVNGDFDCVTAFEIFEHMVAPYNLLKEIKAPKLVASIPLNLWFAKAYWNEEDEWDRHYHEFEPRQFDMLLDKSGWKIIDSQKWKSPSLKIGIRPLLRRITDRYYIVYCERG